MASLRRGLQSYVGLIASKKGRGVKVLWSEQDMMSSYDAKAARIIIDPLALKGIKPPFDGEAVDIVCGLAAHEAAHAAYPGITGKKLDMLVGGINKWASYETNTWPMPNWGLARSLVGHVNNIVEDYLVDGELRKSPARGRYLDAARSYYGMVGATDYEQAEERLTAGDTNIEDVLTVIGAGLLYKKPWPQDLPVETLEVVVDCVEAIRKLGKNKALTKRAAAVEAVCKAVAGFAPKHTPPQPPKPPGGDEEGGGGGTEGCEPAGGDRPASDDLRLRAGGQNRRRMTGMMRAGMGTTRRSRCSARATASATRRSRTGRTRRIRRTPWKRPMTISRAAGIRYPATLPRRSGRRRPLSARM